MRNPERRIAGAGENHGQVLDEIGSSHESMNLTVDDEDEDKSQKGKSSSAAESCEQQGQLYMRV
jgi:hypothetical protein